MQVLGSLNRSGGPHRPSWSDCVVATVRRGHVVRHYAAEMLAVVTGNVRGIRTPMTARERGRPGYSTDDCEDAQTRFDCVARGPIGRRGFDRMQQHFSVKALAGAYLNANSAVL